jgi:hypothetical protein
LPDNGLTNLKFVARPQGVDARDKRGHDKFSISGATGSSLSLPRVRA